MGKPKVGSATNELAATCKEFGKVAFTVQELAVRAHQKNPKRWCMKGFEQYPSEHKVMYRMCGYKGLVARGFLHRLPNGWLQNTDRTIEECYKKELPPQLDSERERLRAVREVDDDAERRRELTLREQLERRRKK